MQLTLYCNSYNGLIPLYHQYNQKTLMCGSNLLSDDILSQCIERGDVLDNTGNNISSLNPYVGDLTGLYWIWKNSDEEYVGTNQYRRFYDEQQLKGYFPLDTNTLFVSNFVSVQSNVWKHYVSCHGSIGLKILLEAVRQNSIAIKKEHIELLHNTSLISPCNMFFGHREVFNRTCNVLFDIVLELFHGCKYTLDHIQEDIHVGRSGDKRLLAFLSERILNIIYFYSYYYLGNVRVQPINYATIN